MKSIGLSIAILYAEKSLRLLSVFGTILAIGTILPMEQIGMLGFAYSLFSICYVITILGLDTVIVKSIIKANEQKEINYVLGTVFFLRLFVALILMGATYFLIDFIWEKETLALYTVCINSGLVMFSVEVIDGFFQSNHMQSYLSSYKMVGILLGLFIKIAAVFWSGDIGWILASIVMDYLLISIFTLAAYTAAGGSFLEWRFDSKAVKELIGESWPILISSVLVVLIFQTDRILIGLLKTSADLGVYSLSVQFASIFNALPIAFGSVWAPILYRQKQNNYFLYVNCQRKAINRLFWASILAALVSFFLLVVYFNVFLMRDLLEAISVFIVYAIAMVFVYQVSLRSRILVLESKAAYIVRISFLAVILGLFLNYNLIDTYGPVGGSYSALLTWASSVLVLPLLWKETRGFPKLFLTSLLPEAVYGIFKKRKS